MAAVYNTATSVLFSLKELYSDDAWVLQDLIYRNNPAWSMLPRDESNDGMGGKYFPIPTVFGSGQGRSATFATAQGNQTAVQGIEFQVTKTYDYALVTVNNDLVQSTKSNLAAFMDTVKMAMDTEFRNLGNDLALSIFGDGSGTRGQINASGLTTGVFTLTDVNQIVNFEIGMSLVACATLGGAPRAAKGYIIGVNRYTGVLTVSATQGSSTAGNPASWAANDYLVVEGDIPAGGVTYTLASTFLKIAGFAAWLPSSTPTATESFFGVDRSVDSRLYGTYYNAANETLEEGLIDACELIIREGGDPDICFTNHASYSALLKSLGAKVQYVDLHSEVAGISFPGIRLFHSKGSMAVMADRSCPSRTGFILTSRHWKIRSINRAPHILTYGPEDGSQGLRVYNADALEMRLGAYVNLTTNAPCYSGQVALSQ